MTRHNAGFILADLLTDHWEFPPFRPDGPAAVTTGQVAGLGVLVAKPRTYMNRSGRAVAEIVASRQLDPVRDLLVLVDDFALPIGTFRLRARGSDGGHNGLRSVEAAVGSPDYARLRAGVGPLPEEREDSADFVLETMSRNELNVLMDVAPEICDAVECWIVEGIEVAMNRFNRRGVAE